MALPDEYGIAPCFANAMLTDEKIPVVCETDIHGVDYRSDASSSEYE